MTVILVVLSLLFSTLDSNASNSNPDTRNSDAPGMNDQEYVIGDDLMM